MKIKYTSIFWTLIIAMMLCITGLLWAGGAFAADLNKPFAKIHCESADLAFYGSEHAALFATVQGQTGNFLYLPSEDNGVMYFMNIDTGKMLELGTNAQDRDYIMVYKSAEHAEVHKPELTSRCFKTPRYK